ncbi:MAG TPA: glycosyl hydrolase, partial [Luteolibacter sp.]|nr:glycosyl hydrolase [Luteolibacter sp.]
MKPFTILLSLTLTLSCGLPGAESLEQQFRNPPDSMKPYCYWYWMNGDITKEGITKDLEAMAKVGIQRAMIGNIQEDPKKVGPVKMFTPEWYDLTRHALKEASRVGVDISMFNAPGWSQTGGPWIKPEESMRRIAWNEIPAKGGKFSAKVRPDLQPLVQDVAVLALPKKNSVTIRPSVLTLAASSWIWVWGEAGGRGVEPCTKYFRRVVQVDAAAMQSANMVALADDSYTLWINGKEVRKGPGTRHVGDEFSVKEYLKQGDNVIAVAVTKSVKGPAGLIAALRIGYPDGKHLTVCTDNAWQSSSVEVEGWREAVELAKPWQAVNVGGPANAAPWNLPINVLRFRHTEPFKARAFSVSGVADGVLYAIVDGKRVEVAKVRSTIGNKDVDLIADGPRVVTFKEVTAQEFEFAPCNLPEDAVMLTSEPMVDQVMEKQMAKMSPSNTPAWETYKFPDPAEPDDAGMIVKQDEILNLSDKLAADGTLTCELPAGDWTIIHFGMVTSGKKNAPAPVEGTGLEVDKMSKKHIESHFNSMFGKLLGELTPQEKKAWKMVTIDSYERGAQNWTDGFDKEFK